MYTADGILRDFTVQNEKKISTKRETLQNLVHQFWFLSFQIESIIAG